MARLLGGGELIEEARAALLDAAQSLGRALAVEGRCPEPAGLDDALLPPLSSCWKEALIPLREFATDSAASWQPVAERLELV